MSSDFVIIGGGIVGLSVARQLLIKFPGAKVVVLEKEDQIALHQTGRNSGVIHSGIYYKPGSKKAENCLRGRELLYQYAAEKGIKFDRCGKVVVATDEAEISRLHSLYDRALGHGLKASKLDQKGLKEIEPHCAGLEAIFVPETGIIDFTDVSDSFKQDFIKAGGEVRLNSKVFDLKLNSGVCEIFTKNDRIESKMVINCGGLYSDSLAEKVLGSLPYRIIPFRGEYYHLHAEHLCRNLIYPVPDLRFPFLGVHFTRMVHGGVECGPNAVFALAKEGYSWREISLSETIRSVSFPGFFGFAKKHWKMGLAEMWRSLSKQAFADSLRKLIPEVKEEMLSPAHAGVRAQAMYKDGSLVDDFVIERQGGFIHVLNAPSPAATSSISIGEYVVGLV